MIPVAASLAVALALGAGEEVARVARGRDAEWATQNAARAKIGLLPRKPPAKVRAAYRNGRLIVPTSGHLPTFLGEPGTLGDPMPPSPPAGDGRAFRVAARGIVTDVTLSFRFDR